MKRFAAFLLCLCFFLSALPFYCSADTVRETRSLADGIVAYELSEAGADTVQAWIDSTLTDEAGNASEWFVITLGQMGSYDFTRYCQSLIQYISEKNPSNKVAQQRYALAFCSAGYTDHDFMKTVIDETFSKQGVMSVIYGLHLLNNGAQSELYTVESAVDALLSRQFEDGGWALNGQVGNIDITCMAVQALAPHASDERVKRSIENALTLMSSLQDADGCYSSFGVKNPESAAQVLCALSSIGIDYKNDARFIKNGCTVLDGILPFRLENGGYSHTLGGAYNATATVQVLYSLISYERMQNGKTPFYIFDGNSSSAETELPDKHKELSIGYKGIAVIAISGASLVVLMVLIVLKKTSKKNFIALFALAAVLIGIVFLLDVKAPDDYYTMEPPKKENPIGSVTLSICCDTLIGKADPVRIPENGVILHETVFEIAQGDTAYTVLTDAAKAFGLHLEKSGAAGMIYITGINNLYEFDFGDLSGWNYFINGESISIGCDQYVLRDQDTIEWRYTLELGKDLD